MLVNMSISYNVASGLSIFFFYAKVHESERAVRSGIIHYTVGHKVNPRGRGPIFKHVRTISFESKLVNSQDK